MRNLVTIQSLQPPAEASLQTAPGLPAEAFAVMTYKLLPNLAGSLHFELELNAQQPCCPCQVHQPADCAWAKRTSFTYCCWDQGLQTLMSRKCAVYVVMRAHGLAVETT